MLEFVKEVIDQVEKDCELIDRESAMRRLRPLGLDQFGALLLSMPNAAYPRLSALLPAMASDSVQRDWTGNSGPALLTQSVAFVRSMVYNFASLTGRGIDQATVLDFGCGYGRLTRLMYALTDSRNVYGVDPWPTSIEICGEAGLTDNYFLSDYLPTSLPLGDVRFDLAYAFSVFTHLSERATLAALRTLRAYLKPDGLLLVTIRPIEYWLSDGHTSDNEKTQLMAAHRATGFAFKSHIRAAVDGDVTYGDTSLSLDWLIAQLPEWEIAGTDYLEVDRLQRLVFLRPG